MHLILATQRPVGGCYYRPDQSQTFRHASLSRYPRRSIRGPYWIRPEPSSCWGTVICCIWRPEPVCRCGCMVLLWMMRKYTGWLITLRAGGSPSISRKFSRPRPISCPGSGGQTDDSDAEADPLYDEAVRIVTETRRASISGVQRRLKIGYNRAARMIEQMEASGIVGPQQSNGNREVMAPPPPEL